MTVHDRAQSLPGPLATGGAGTRRYETAETAPGWVLACTDACERCGLPYVPPTYWAVREGILITAHRCMGCGHGWAPRWDVDTVGGAA